MMIEVKDVRQLEKDVKRRWFSDDYFDLIVWENGNLEILRFELCYGKSQDEHAFVWSSQTGRSHLKVDDGEDAAGRHKKSPIFMPDGHFDRDTIASRFLAAAKDIDPKIAGFVIGKLNVSKGW